MAVYRQLPKPAVTRTLGDMEKKGLIRKLPDVDDRRVLHLEFTEKGQKLYTIYVHDYFRRLAEQFSSISNEEVEAMSAEIRRIAEAYFPGTKKAESLLIKSQGVI